MKISLLFLILSSCLIAESPDFRPPVSVEAPIVIPRKIALISAGLPGVGKSTLLKALSQHISNSIFLDKDTINACLLQGNAYASDYYKCYVKNQSYDLLFALAKDNLAQGDRVIFLDGFFGDKLSSPLVSAFTHSENYETKIIFFYCSPEVNLQRIIKRGGR